MSVLILMYHGVERKAGPLFVDPDRFAEQLDVIAESGLPVVTAAQAADRIATAGSSEPAVALTFDDAFASVVEEAAPLLLQRGMRATVFCVGGHLGGTNDWPTARPGAPSVPLAGADDLAELVAAGFEIGAHGFAHAPLVSGDQKLIRREVVDARSALEHALGASVTTFAYPYGAPPSAAARRAIAETYRAACTTRPGRARPGLDRFALPRVDAHYVDSPQRLERLLRGGGDAYLVVRRLGAAARRRLRPDYLG